MVDNTDDLACAMFLLAGLKELGGNPEMIAGAFEADPLKVSEVLTAGAGVGRKDENEEKENEID